MQEIKQFLISVDVRRETRNYLDAAVVHNKFMNSVPFRNENTLLLRPHRQDCFIYEMWTCRCFSFKILDNLSVLLKQICDNIQHAQDLLKIFLKHEPFFKTMIKYNRVFLSFFVADNLSLIIIEINSFHYKFGFFFFNLDVKFYEMK